MVEETRQTNTVVRKVRLFTEDSNIIFTFLCVVFQNLFSRKAVSNGWPSYQVACAAYMKEMPTMPRPTTTSLFRGGNFSSIAKSMMLKKPKWSKITEHPTCVQTRHAFI